MPRPHRSHDLRRVAAGLALATLIAGVAQAPGVERVFDELAVRAR